MPPALIAAAPAIIGAVGQIAGGVMGQSAASTAASKIYSQPVGWIRTPNSFVQSGAANIDPQIRALRESLLRQYQGLGPQYQALIDQAGTNEGGYVRSVVDPYAQQVAGGWGDLLSNQQNRQIRGNSFANADIINFARDTGRGLSDVTANALERSIGLRSGLLQQYGQNVLAPQDELNQQQLAQELASLGLSYNQVVAMLEQSRIAQAARAGGNLAQGGALMGIGNILGSAIGGGAPGAGGGGGGGSVVPMGGGTNFSMAG